MRSEIKNIEELIQKFSLLKLAAGERLILLDPEGNRYVFQAKKPGIYNVHIGSLIKNRRTYSVTEVILGAQYSERGGPPYRERTLEFFWGPELSIHET